MEELYFFTILFHGPSLDTREKSWEQSRGYQRGPLVVHVVTLPTGGTAVEPTYFPDFSPFIRQKLSAAGCRVGNSSAFPSNIQKRLSAATGKIEVKASCPGS